MACVWACLQRGGQIIREKAPQSSQLGGGEKVNMREGEPQGTTKCPCPWLSGRGESPQSRGKEQGRLLSGRRWLCFPFESQIAPPPQSWLFCLCERRMRQGHLSSSTFYN